MTSIEFKKVPSTFLTSNLDVDIIIFSLLDINTLYNACNVSKYYNHVHNQYMLWHIKVKELHDDFPMKNIGIDCLKYKQLYYCLYYKKYSHITSWLNTNNHDDVIRWFVKNNSFFIKIINKNLVIIKNG